MSYLLSNITKVSNDSPWGPFRYHATFHPSLNIRGGNTCIIHGESVEDFVKAVCEQVEKHISLSPKKFKAEFSQICEQFSSDRGNKNIDRLTKAERLKFWELIMKAEVRK